jgi:hypothetical protein
MTCPTFLAQPGVQNGMIMWNQPRVSGRAAASLESSIPTVTRSTEHIEKMAPALGEAGVEVDGEEQCRDRHGHDVGLPPAESY